MDHPYLHELRRSLDNIDQAMILLLAERCKITRRVGLYKKEQHLPAVDEEREQRQLARIREIASVAGVDVVLAEKFLRLIIDHAVAEHLKIFAESSPQPDDEASSRD